MNSIDAEGVECSNNDDRPAPIATPHPLDFSALKKGDYIPPERIEEIYQVKRGEPDFDFARMNLRKQIKKHRTDLVVKAQKGGLLICPDLLASEHLARFVKRGERIIKNGARELANRVDTRGFDEGQKKLHETRTRVGQGFVLGIQWAKRSLRSGALPEVSTRPRLPGPKNV